MALTTVEEAQTRELIAQQAAILALASNEATITSKLGATKVNLSQLPAASALSDSDIVLVRQGTTDKSSALSIIKSWMATASGFSISLLANGYIKLPAWLGGLIVQWGTSAAATSGTIVTFPIMFPNECLSVHSSPTNSPTTPSVFCSSSQVSTSQMKVWGSGASVTASWVAIGY